MFYADDAALVSHTEAHLYSLVDRLSLTISLRMTNIMTQGAGCIPSIGIDSQTTEVVGTSYPGSTIYSPLSLEVEVNIRRHGKTEQEDVSQQSRDRKLKVTCLSWLSY